MSGAGTPSQLGKYEIRGTLGKGAMGTVYDGWDPIIDRRVAIKTVRLPDADDEESIEGLARFKREAQAAGRLLHPNIVGVFDYGETAELAYIVMEFVTGRSLKEMLAGNERMAATDAASLMAEVLAGLAYSHDKNVVHRDIKPANIMVTVENQAKIADFGIARIEASSMTQAGTIMGTPAYMSPEQFMGQVVDRRTDIYSCGVLLYQLLTGERPFEGSMTSIMHKAMTTTPPRPSELAVTAPPALDAVVTKAMARRPEDRFETAMAFATSLRAAIAASVDDDGDATTIMKADALAIPPIVSAPVAAPVSVPGLPSGIPTRHNRTVLMAGGVGAILAALIGFYGLRTIKPKSAAVVAPIASQNSPVSLPVVRSASDIEAALGARLSRIDCSLAHASVQQNQVIVAGLVQNGEADERLRAAVAEEGAERIDMMVQRFDGPFCPVLDLLRPMMKVASAGSQMLEVAQLGAGAPLKDNDAILLKATMPGFKGFLHLAYLQSDGQVSPLVPGAGYPQQSVNTGSTLEFGRARADFSGWHVGPPFGTDMILVIASSAPLFPNALPATQKLTDYTASLLGAVENLQQHGGKFSANALVLETAPAH